MILQELGRAGTIFMGLFAIMNPVANTPIFLGLTAGDDPKIRRAVAVRSLVLAFVVILCFSLLGKLVFHAFGISLPALRITGGILIFLVGYRMLHGEQSTMHNPSREDSRSAREAALDVAVSPLAVPILVGPGTIATAMNFSATGNFLDVVLTVASFAALCGITYLFFLSGEKFVLFIGKNGIKVVTRLMGLILAVLGTQMVMEGVHGATVLFR